MAETDPTFDIVVDDPAVDDPAGEFNCRGDEAVLFAMERHNQKQIPVGCRNGGCGICKVRVDKGSFTTGKMSRARVTEEEEADGYALACRLFPTSDLVVEVTGLDPASKGQASKGQASKSPALVNHINR